MSKLKISYLVTVHNEDTSLDKCITTIVTHKDDEDEIIVLDDFSDNPKTQEILQRWKYAAKISMIFPTGTIEKTPNVRVMQHALDKNYGGHKNFGNEQCTGDWIFQIDGDEIPNPNLIINLKTIIESNPNADLIYVPRINDFIGVTPEHAAKWGWRLTPCDACEGRPVVNWPDYQSRIYKRNDKIRWDRRLHEKIEGHNEFVTIPAETDLALYHDKTIETQVKTNVRYNEWFSAEENQGHNVFDKTIPPRKFQDTLVKYQIESIDHNTVVFSVNSLSATMKIGELVGMDKMTVRPQSIENIDGKYRITANIINK